MPRPKGSKNKITIEVKEQLQSLIDEVVNSIDVNLMDTNQKLKLLQLSLHYVLPKLRSSSKGPEEEEGDMPIFIDIHERDENDNWVVDRTESSIPNSLVQKQKK
jgi:hypothetical protein